MAALRRVRGRACRRGGEARVADHAICSKPARTVGRLLRPTHRDLAASTRAGAPSDARRPALQPKAREAPAEAVLAELKHTWIFLSLRLPWLSIRPLARAGLH